MMGSTYNGQFEPVERVDGVLEEIFQVGWGPQPKSEFSSWAGGRGESSGGWRSGRQARGCRCAAAAARSRLPRLLCCAAGAGV